jgi:thioesterase domain-containing protein
VGVGRPKIHESVLRAIGRTPVALQSQGFNGKLPRRSIEAMAAHYLEEVRTAQPHGPYSLGGYCLGAFVAFEMAQQLRARGEEVALLAIFVGYGPRAKGVSGRVRYLAQRMGFHVREARSRPRRLKVAYVRQKAGDASRDFAALMESLRWRLAYRLVGGAQELPSWMLRNVEELNLKAARTYVPRPYPGRMTVFLSGETPPGFFLDPKRDLDGLVAREIELLTVPGATDTMMREPHVAVLSERLQNCLQSALKHIGSA